MYVTLFVVVKHITNDRFSEKIEAVIFGADLGEGPGGARAPLILSKKRRNDRLEKSQHGK